MEDNKSYSTEMNNDVSRKRNTVLEQQDFTSVLEKLKDFNNFRSFADSVVFYMKKHYDGDFSKKREFNCFKKMCYEAKVDEICTDKTWRNWKNCDSWPDDRKTAFKIAFALRLTTEETEEFFKKAFFDRPIDAKSVSDVVYYYCIENNLSWEKAGELLNKISTETKKQKSSVLYDQNVIFSSVQQAADNLYISIAENESDNPALQFSADLENTTKGKLLKEASEKEIIEHCVKLGSYYSENHNIRLKKTAKKWLDRAMEYYKNNSEEKRLCDYIKTIIPDFEPYIEKSCVNETSASLLNNIVGLKLYNHKDGKTSTKNNLSFMQKRIINQIPAPDVLDKIRGEECENAKQLRNTIILMAFYRLCMEGKNNDDIITIINNALILSGSYPLYIGAPFDWLFFFCLYSKVLPPLYCFHALFDSAYEHEVKQIIEIHSEDKKEAHIDKDVYSDLTSKQKDLFVKAREGDETAKSDLAESFTLPTEFFKDKCGNPISLFKKELSEFKFKRKDIYNKAKGQMDFDENQMRAGNVYSVGNANPDLDEDLRKIFISSCMKSIDSYNENNTEKDGKSAKLTTWISLKYSIILQHPDVWDEYIPNPSFSDTYGDWKEEQLKKYTDLLDDTSKWIMELRLGFSNEPICNITQDLINKMKKKHQIEIDRDDILLAEQRFIRIVALQNAERNLKNG